ncbi:MAG: cbb3-type cytochrome oxidase assembly protein CcoS [Bdellovibrionaceae bacterium]|nr:cbb3-type cytochrome oxidase assembly protein CcoS [Pseudobdellovibrionaceae bacterium]|tara:strand:- start:62499 stop:62678 length:180 start_codon:yes stop_codon:yes gene_type:complete
MTILYLMIPCTLILVAAFVAAFIWANESDQFDDLETPAFKILIDEQNVTQKDSEETENV